MIVLRTKTYSWFNFGRKKTAPVEESAVDNYIDNLMNFIKRCDYPLVCDQIDELSLGECSEKTLKNGMNDKIMQRIESLLTKDFNRKIQALFNKRNVGKTKDYELRCIYPTSRENGIMYLRLEFTNDLDPDKGACIEIPLNVDRGETNATIHNW